MVYETCETHGQQIDTRGKYCLFVDEPGFYELVFKSRLPSARIFREWVFAKVLPSIRKYGYYRMIDLRIKQRVIFDGKNTTSIKCLIDMLQIKMEIL